VYYNASFRILDYGAARHQRSAVVVNVASLLNTCTDMNDNLAIRFHQSHLHTTTAKQDEVSRKEDLLLEALDKHFENAIEVAGYKNY